MKTSCRFVLTGLFLVTFLTGCGYKMGQMTVGGIRTIALAAVENETGVSTIDEALVSNSLAREFARDGNVRLVSSDLAQAVLSVKLTGYNQRAEVFTDQNVGESFRLVIDAEIKVHRTSDNSILYQGTLQGEKDYDTFLDQSEIERTATRAAITDLAIDIVRSIVEGGW